jgi:hypothetical protein
MTSPFSAAPAFFDAFLGFDWYYHTLFSPKTQDTAVGFFPDNHVADSFLFHIR